MGQVQIVNRGNPVADETHHHGHIATLAIDIDTKAPQIRQIVGEVHLQLGFEGMHLLIGHQRVGQLLRDAGLQQPVADRSEDTLYLDLDGSTHTEKQVRRLLVYH